MLFHVQSIISRMVTSSVLKVGYAEVKAVHAACGDYFLDYINETHDVWLILFIIIYGPQTEIEN